MGVKETKEELKLKQQLTSVVDQFQKKESVLLAVSKNRLKTLKDIQSITGMTNDQSKAYLDTQTKVRSIADEIRNLQYQQKIETNSQVQSQQKLLDQLSKRINNEKKIGDFFGKFKDNWDDFWSVAQDPRIAGGLFLIASIDKMKQFGSAIMEAQTSMGMTIGQTAEVASAAGMASLKGMALGIGFKDALEAAGSLNEEMGDLNSVTTEAISNVAYITKHLGLATAESAKFHKMMKQIGGGTDAAAINMTKFVEGLARANKVAPGAVMKDIQSDTEGFAAYAKDGGRNIAEAAVYAKKLGIQFSTLTKMANSLLDIETSIEAEMNASVLLGRQINMNKARELALAGDLAGAAKAAFEQLGGIQEFESMNMIQRQAAANAAGIELSELQSIASNRDKQIQMGLVEASSSEKRLKSLKGIGSTIKENMGFIAATMNFLVSMKNLDIVRNTIAAAHWVKAKAHAAFMKLMGQESPAKDALKSKISSTIPSPSKASDAAAGTSGKGSTGFMKSLGKIDMKKVLMGAAAMVVVAGAVFIFAKAVQEFMGVSWEAVGMAVVSMLALVGAVSLLGAIMMSGVGAVAIILGAAAMLIVAAAVLVLAFALTIMSKALPSFMLFIPMLPELAMGMLMMLPALGAMMLMGIALPLLGTGLLAASLGVLLFSAVGGPKLLMALGEAIQKIAPNAAGLLATGPALAGLGVAMGIAGVGFGLFALAGGNRTVKRLGEDIPKLAVQAPMILMLADAFRSLASSLLSLSASLLVMLPTLPILGLLAIAVPALKALSGLGPVGGGEAKEEEQQQTEEQPGTIEIIGKLDELIGAIREGGIINMDGKKVGDVIALASTPRRV